MNTNLDKISGIYKTNDYASMRENYKRNLYLSTEQHNSPILWHVSIFRFVQAEGLTAAVAEQVRETKATELARRVPEEETCFVVYY